MSSSTVFLTAALALGFAGPARPAAPAPVSDAPSIVWPGQTGGVPTLYRLAAQGHHHHHPTGNPPPPPPPPTPPPPTTNGWIWGVTSDGPMVNTGQQVAALAALPRRNMVRTVFDPPDGSGHPNAGDYLPSVTQILAVADVMGQPIDSSEMANTPLGTVQTRIQQYLAALGDQVTLWEVGNEVNGNWLGTGVMPKVRAMYDAVKAAGKPTAITFYYENPPTPGYEMFSWIAANIPPGDPIRQGLDYALMDYYEDENNGHQLTQAETDAAFTQLSAIFPYAKVGFGECGYGGRIPTSAADRAAMLQRFYGYRPTSTTLPYIGGVFYWEFRQTMVPDTLPDWAVLNALEGP